MSRINLLEGKIFTSLTKLALPIMATSLIQMAYNLTDMIWIGKLSANAVAAVGAAGMFMWFSESFAMLARMGGQVKVGQSLGAGNREAASQFAKNAFQLGLFLAFIYSLIMMTFTRQFIRIVGLNETQTVNDAVSYLKIVSVGVMFACSNQIFTGLFTASGNSKIPFLATATGLVINIVLDPLLIFNANLGVAGAAIATVTAQAVVTSIFILFAIKDTHLFVKIKMLSKPNFTYIKDIIKIGYPSAMQNMMFSSISMVISRIVAGFGDSAVAVQKVGTQIESISWMTADGFAVAVNSFVAQNYGAGNMKRAKKGYHTSLIIMSLWGLFTSCLLIFAPAPIFKIFIDDPKVVALGVDYLIILGFSQFFMCVEIICGGAFAGFGRTLPPSISNIVLTLARIPTALILCRTALGLNGIWWSITISGILKGIVLFVLFTIFITRFTKTHQENAKS